MARLVVMSFQTTRPWFCSQGSLECWCIFICSIHSLMILNPKQFGVFVQRISRQCSDGSWASDLLRWVHQAYQSHDSLYWIIQLWSSLVGEFISLSKCYLTDNCITVDLFVRDILFTYFTYLIKVFLNSFLQLYSLYSPECSSRGVGVNWIKGLLES